MNNLSAFEIILISYFLITKIIPTVITYLLEKIFGVKIKVKSVSLLSASIKDINVRWKNVEIAMEELNLNSKIFNSSYKKVLCIVSKNVKLCLHHGEVTDLEQWKCQKNNKIYPTEVHQDEFMKSFGFYFNPNVLWLLEFIEFHFEDFSFITLDVDKCIKTKICRPEVKLNLGGYEKTFKRASSKNELLLVVRNKDEKWKHFSETYFLPEFNFFVDKYKDFEVREDDIIISGFPRSGTTRAQEMVWLIANDCDFEGALRHESDVRCPYFDHPGWSFLFRKNTMACSLDEMPSPRILKTHLPVQLLPDQVWTKKPKIIYVSRDVKDVAVSNYHFWYSFDVKRKLSANEYFDYFLKDIILYGPYRESVQNYFNIPNYENIIYITYEDMCADLDGTIMKVSEFLGKSVAHEDLQKLKEHLSFENMKKNEATNNKSVLVNIQKFTDAQDGDSDNFIRKGIIGDHKNIMCQEYIDRFDKWWTESSSLSQGFSYSKNR